MSSARLPALRLAAAAALLLLAGCDPVVIRWGGGYRGPVPEEELAFRRVERDYLRYIERNPRDPAAPAQLAERYRRRGDFAKAEEYFQKALGLSPRFYFARACLAALYLDTDRPREAVAEAEKAVADNPGDAAIFALLARARRASDDRPGARQALAEGLKLDPESCTLLLESARLFADSGDLAAAAAECRRAIKADPKNAPAHADLALVLTDGLSVLIGQLPIYTNILHYRLREALSSAQAAVKLDDSSPAIWEVLAHCRELSGDAAGAAAAWRRALKLDPDRALARARLAALLESQNRGPEAEAEYRELVSRVPRQRAALERLAAQARARGPLAAELAVRLQLARAFPEDAPAQREAARALQRAGEPARAGEFWERLGRLLPGDPGAQREAAEALERARRPALAGECWERLRRLAPDDLGALHGLARCARSPGSAAKPGTATFYYQAALAKSPADPEALEGLAAMAVEENRLEEALGLYERLVKAVPGNAGHRLLLGLLAAATGDNARAAEELSVAVKLNDAFPEAHRELADALRKLDQPERAAAEARRAVELAPRDARAWALLGRIEKDAGRKPAALAACARAVEESGAADPGLLWAACDAAVDAGDRPAAAGFCRKLLGFEPERAGAARVLAKLAAAGASPGEELYWLGAVLAAASPADPRRRDDRRRFEALCRQERPAAGALELYRADYARDPHNPATLTGLGSIERLRGDLPAAAGHYERWLADEPASRPAAAALSIIYAKLAGAARSDREAKRLREKSLGAALRLVAIDRESAPARLVLARAYGAVGDRRRQEMELRAAGSERIDPKNPAVHNNLGVVLAAAGRLAEARGEFERAAELAASAAWPVHNLAVLTGKDLNDPEVAGRYRAKCAALVKAGAEPPPDAEAYWEFVPEEER